MSAEYKKEWPSNPRERRAYAHAIIAQAKRNPELIDFAQEAVEAAGDSRKSRASGFDEALDVLFAKERMPYRQFIEDVVIKGSSSFGMRTIVRILNGDLRLKVDPQKDMEFIREHGGELSAYGKWMICASQIPWLRRSVNQGLVTPETAVEHLETLEKTVGRGVCVRSIVAIDMARTEVWMPQELHSVIRTLARSPIDLFR